MAAIFNRLAPRSNQREISMEEVIAEVGKVTRMEKVENVKNVTWDDVGGLETAK